MPGTQLSTKTRTSLRPLPLLKVSPFLIIPNHEYFMSNSLNFKFSMTKIVNFMLFLTSSFKAAKKAHKGYSKYV